MNSPVLKWIFGRITRKLNQSKAKIDKENNEHCINVPNMYVWHSASLSGLGNSQSYDPAIVCRPHVLCVRQGAMLAEDFLGKFSTFQTFLIPLGPHCNLDIIFTDWHAA